MISQNRHILKTREEWMALDCKVATRQSARYELRDQISGLAVDLFERSQVVNLKQGLAMEINTGARMDAEGGPSI